MPQRLPTSSVPNNLAMPLVNFTLMPGQAHDLRALPGLIEDLAADHLLADCAFDADSLSIRSR